MRRTMGHLHGQKADELAVPNRGIIKVAKWVFHLRSAIATPPPLAFTFTPASRMEPPVPMHRDDHMASGSTGQTV